MPAGSVSTCLSGTRCGDLCEKPWRHVFEAGVRGASLCVYKLLSTQRYELREMNGTVVKMLHPSKPWEMNGTIVRVLHPSVHYGEEKVGSVRFGWVDSPSRVSVLFCSSFFYQQIKCLT
jgi:hypothetical protein